SCLHGGSTNCSTRPRAMSRRDAKQPRTRRHDSSIVFARPSRRRPARHKACEAHNLYPLRRMSGIMDNGIKTVDNGIIPYQALFVDSRIRKRLLRGHQGKGRSAAWTAGERAFL